MPRFRLVSVVEEQELGFACDRCCASNDEQCSFDTYNRPYQRSLQIEGQCVTCEGTGFEPEHDNELCSECGGSGVCPECDGKAHRGWETLPDDVQDELMLNWNSVGSQPSHYSAILSLYRKW
jgi:hypothetical protein